MRARFLLNPGWDELQNCDPRTLETQQEGSDPYQIAMIIFVINDGSLMSDIEPCPDSPGRMVVEALDLKFIGGGRWI